MTLVCDPKRPELFGDAPARLAKLTNEVWNPVPKGWPDPESHNPFRVAGCTTSTGRGGSGAVPKEKLGWKTLRFVFRRKLRITVVKFFTMDIRSELK